MARHGIEVTETAFADLAVSFGDLLVARSRGEPADEVAGSTRALAGRYRRRRRDFDGVLDATEVGGGAPDDRAALENMRATLEWFDELEPTPGARPTAGGTAAEDAATRGLRATTYRRYGLAASRIRVGGETIDRLTALGRLGSEPDPATRRAIFEAMAPVWQAVDGDGGDASPYRRLVASTAARWATHGSTIEANATALGLAPGTAEATFRSILRAWKAVMGPTELEPWDYRYAVGAASRQLDARAPQDRLLAINHAYLAALGAEPAALRLRTTSCRGPGDRSSRSPSRRARAWRRIRPPRPAGGRDPPGSSPPTRKAASATSRNSCTRVATRSRPPGSACGRPSRSTRWRPPPSSRPRPTSWAGTSPSRIGSDAGSGDAADPRDALLDRYGAVMLDVCWALFEIVVHRHPDRRPNDIWSEIAHEGLGVIPHPEWSWWAVRGQLIESPGYLANYALSAIVAAAVRARILELRGPWWDGDPGWYPFVAEALFAPGRRGRRLRCFESCSVAR